MRHRKVDRQEPGSERKVRALAPLLLDWFAQNARDLPWRKTRDPYAIWVSEIMLQQTQVKTVVPYWNRWMRTLPTLRTLAKASPARIHKLWEGLGYYTRVRNLHEAAREITKQRGGKFPSAFEAVLALPGVGRYTAGAICSIAFNQPTPVLDGNVMRVLTRLFGIAGDPRERKTNARLWQLATQLVTRAAALDSNTRPSACSHLNQSLMELGAVTCAPRNPNCLACPVARHCAALREGRVAELPKTKPRAATTAHRSVAFVVERAGRFLIRQRSDGVVNARLWEFPNVELASPDDGVAHAARRFFGRRRAQLESLGVVKHTITRHRIALEVFRVEFAGRPARFGNAGRWATLVEMRRLAFTGAHRRVLEMLKPDGG